jgi:hypothetical protein
VGCAVAICCFEGWVACQDGASETLVWREDEDDGGRLLPAWRHQGCFQHLVGFRDGGRARLAGASSNSTMVVRA